MARSELGIAQAKPASCRNLKEMLDVLQGSIYFVRKLTASNVLEWFTPKHRTCQLTIPRWFVREHGNKFRRSVVLLSGQSHKPWPHRLAFCISRPIMPEVAFSGGWKGFAGFNGLSKGDQLIFSLTAMSEFQVFMFDRHGDPKLPQAVPPPVKWLEKTKISMKIRTNQSLGYHKDEEAAVGEDYADLEYKVCSMCAKPKAISENDFAGSISSDTCSQDSSSFSNKPIEAKIEWDVLSKSQICLPSFSRQLEAMNVSRLEIPLDFATMNGSRLLSSVQLQGILDGSPLHNVQINCYVTQAHARIVYIEGAAWKDFVRDNMLRVGQELVFTLTANSFFTVREEIFWNPRTGFNKVPSPLLYDRAECPSSTSGKVFPAHLSGVQNLKDVLDRKRLPNMIKHKSQMIVKE